MRAYYEHSTGDLLRVTARDGKLVATISGITVHFVPLNAYQFQAVDAPAPAKLEFIKVDTHPVSNHPAQLLLHIEGQQPVLYDPVTLASPTPSQLAEYNGDYFSDELSVTYSLRAEGDKLYFKMPRRPQTPLTPTIKDAFITTSGLRVNFLFLRDSANRINGYTINAGRVRNLRFVKKSN